jgi:hypothetical protein
LSIKDDHKIMRAFFSYVRAQANTKLGKISRNYPREEFHPDSKVITAYHYVHFTSIKDIYLKSSIPGLSSNLRVTGRNVAERALKPLNLDTKIKNGIKSYLYAFPFKISSIVFLYV